MRQTRIAWDRGHLVKYRINPIAWANLYLGHLEWQTLLVGEQGASLYDKTCTFDKPKAVYPVWLADTEPLSVLMQLCADPVGDNVEICSDPGIDSSIRPVLGQDHTIVITNTPHAGRNSAKILIRELQQVKQAFPGVRLHLHDMSHSWEAMFSHGWDAVSAVAFRGPTDKTLYHPAGGKVDWDKLPTMWIELLGFQPVDMKIHRNRVIYNMKSALWAAANWNANVKFQVRKTKDAKSRVNPHATVQAPVTGGRIVMGNAKPQLGDKYVCNACSLANQCKFFRLGAVCSVPDAEPVKLSEMFGTRNAEKIVDGLAHLLGMQANRLEQGMRDETADGELSPEVTKISNQLFQNGVKLAQLVEPTYRPSGVKVQINNNVGAAQENSAPSIKIAEAIRVLEAKGIHRDDITPELLAAVLPELNKQQALPAARVIEGQAQ